jgi:hypothetical protein
LQRCSDKSGNYRDIIRPIAENIHPFKFLNFVAFVAPLRVKMQFWLFSLFRVMSLVLSTSHAGHIAHWQTVLSYRLSLLIKEKTPLTIIVRGVMVPDQQTIRL